MTTYAVTILDSKGIRVTFRNVNHATMLDGLFSFGGIKLYANRRSPIISWKYETHTPTADEITCHGQFGCD